MDHRAAIETVGVVVDAAGVAVIVTAIGLAGLSFARALVRDLPFEPCYRRLRLSMGRGILLGLELLVAGDIIRTAGVAPTFTSVGVLALIVAIRTFLSISLEVEVTGRWPWQAHHEAASDVATGTHPREPGSGRFRGGTRTRMRKGVGTSCW